MAPIAASSRYTGDSGYATISTARLAPIAASSRYAVDSEYATMSSIEDDISRLIIRLPLTLREIKQHSQFESFRRIHRTYQRILLAAREIIAREKKPTISVPTSEPTISVPTPKTIKVSNGAIPNIKDYILPKPTKTLNYSGPKPKPTQYPQRRK